MKVGLDDECVNIAVFGEGHFPRGVECDHFGRVRYVVAERDIICIYLATIITCYSYDVYSSNPKQRERALIQTRDGTEKGEAR